MSYINPDEVGRRIALLKRTWKLCERQGDEEVIDGALAATSQLTLVQLEAACVHVTRNDPKGPLLRGILASVDIATRQLQQRADRERDTLIVPAVPIDTTQPITQHAILRRYARPSSSPTWTHEELAQLKADLEHDSPKLAESNARVRADLEYFRDHSRFPAR